MKVFSSEPAILKKLIDAFPGTAASGCFDLSTGGAIIPHPNRDKLKYGSKA